MKTSLRILIVLLLVVGAGFLYWNYNNSPTETQDVPSIDVSPDDKAAEVATGEVRYYRDVRGYLALPDDEGPRPALVLIHEWWGLDDNVKNFAKNFAKEGYVVLAVDLYGGKSTEDPSVARELASNVRKDMDGAFANLSAAVEFLGLFPNVKKDSLASVGWCFGGGWSYQMAKNNLGVNASVVYYGQFNPEDDLSIMRASILGHFGEEDASILVDDVRSFEAKLATLSGEHQIFIYPNAGHAFANEDNEASYVPEAAELSWTRTLEFLDSALYH